MKRSLAIMLLCVAACRAQPSGEPAAPPLEAVIKKALPSVVLLVRYQSDGAVGFGAGLLLDDHGLVLTNLHVIDHAVALSGMLHETQHRTYTVLEGGLKRFLFEQQDRLVSATEVRRDEALDLALVRLATRTKGRPRLPISTRALALGEPVVAVGHPGEMLWSFTTGVVSALPDRMIQHDALVSPGSSGGPLLDRRGDVVGIDTAMVKAPRGAGFARPAPLVRAFLDEIEPAAAVDLSTPDRATETCLRALERHIDVECGTSATETVMWVDSAADGLPTELKDALPLDLLPPWRGLPAGYLLNLAAHNWIDGINDPLPSIVRCEAHDGLCSGAPSVLSPEAQRELSAAISGLATADRARLIAAARGLQARAEAASVIRAKLLKAQTGFASWRTSELRDRLRGGYRVGKVERRAPEAAGERPTAWVLVEGRTLKDERYTFSVLRSEEEGGFVSFGRDGLQLSIPRAPGGWMEIQPSTEQAARRPEGWPPPLGDAGSDADQVNALVARTVLELAGAR